MISHLQTKNKIYRIIKEIQHGMRKCQKRKKHLKIGSKKD